MARRGMVWDGVGLDSAWFAGGVWRCVAVCGGVWCDVALLTIEDSRHPIPIPSLPFEYHIAVALLS